jgi:hypothetical protein
VGRHRHQHRAVGDCRLGWIGGCGARPYSTRIAEGRSRAQQRGQHVGRPSKLTEAQKAEARRRRAQGATLAELARSYGVGRVRFSDCDGEGPRLDFVFAPVKQRCGSMKYFAAPSRPVRKSKSWPAPCFIFPAVSSILDRLCRAFPNGAYASLSTAAAKSSRLLSSKSAKASSRVR